MQITENSSLRKYTSLQIGGTARYLANITEYTDIQKLLAFAQEKELPLVILGSGTNSIFHDGTINAVIGIMKLAGKTILSETNTQCVVEAQAGENWDTLVAWSVKKNLSGLEALSAIPGTTGAAPVQNIGAYGSELADTLVSLTVFDTTTQNILTLEKEDCQFTYRNSIFKQNPGRYIILSVQLQLSKRAPQIPDYKDVQDYFAHHPSKPTVQEIRKAIIEIRKNKLPDPSVIPNAGSFFKNPIIQNTQADELLKQYPDMPTYPVDDSETKLFAGWLLEHCGFKGKSFGNIGLYEKNALVVTTNGTASYEDLESAQQTMIDAVYEKFGVTLEIEPQVLF